MINKTSENATTEKPLVILRPKRRYFWAYIIIILFGTIYFIFGVVKPVLTTGDYASVWPAGDMYIGKKIVLFYISWLYFICLPCIIPTLKTGDYYFYNDWLEVKPIVGQKTKIIPYRQMHVWRYKSWCLLITLQSIPSLAHPIQRYKIRYWDGLMLMLTPSKLRNPEDVPKMMQIIQKKAYVIVEKKSIFS